MTSNTPGTNAEVSPVTHGTRDAEVGVVAQGTDAKVSAAVTPESASPVRAIKRATRQRLPKDLVDLLRKRFGTPRPWDPGVVLPPPAAKPGERIGPPDFVGVGTQKSGTSWWYEVIATHSAVHDVEAAHKERHYFSTYFDKPFTTADVERYHCWFPRPEGKLVGEWTPQYMHQAWVPRLLAQAAPDTKLLVLLRDPIERYRSGLTHYAARDWELDDRLAVDAANRGLYAHQLQRLHRSFAEDQVLVLQYEACRADPQAAARTTFAFLDLDPEQETTGIESEINTTRMEKVNMPDHLRSTLQELYDPDVAELTKLVPSIDLDLWPNFRHRP